LSEVALGNVPADIVITHGRLFNGYTREFIPDQSIWIKNGWIAYVGPDHDPQKIRIPNSSTQEAWFFSQV